MLPQGDFPLMHLLSDLLNDPHASGVMMQDMHWSSGTPSHHALYDALLTLPRDKVQRQGCLLRMAMTVLVFFIPS